ncbi:hypothetical protein GJ698_20935 [Pseudoduganella sp. FT26W]|uniref:Uncharacterized protein n=1 Tax=Duganella aquatilis TaxID=2666082 RepID=A0A844DEB1_9BURK|nr:hypothetical protein [Duganella aquatilis]MRW86540.1 hypothetical protein [Duganella aquatilis]
METRIAKLEELMTDTRERLVRIEERLEQCATKTDLEALRAEMHKGFSEMIKWIVGTAIVMSGTGIVVMTFVPNNAVPKAPPPAPLPPVVIYTQPAPAALPKM